MVTNIQAPGMDLEDDIDVAGFFSVNDDFKNMTPPSPEGDDSFQGTEASESNGENHAPEGST